MKPRVALLWTEQLLRGGSARSAARNTPVARSFFNSTPPHVRPGLPRPSLEQSALLYLRYQRAALARRFRSLRFKSDGSGPRHHDPTPHLGSPEPAPSLSQRLKQLSREYGWAALGVYFGLSLLDFPFCFLAVRLLGTDRIGHYEDVVKNAFWSLVRLVIPDAGKSSAHATTADDIAAEAAKNGTLGADGLAVRAGAAANACKTPLLILRTLLPANIDFSHLEPARSRLPCPQVPHLLPSTTDRGSSSKGSQNPKEMGLQYWKEEAQAYLRLEYITWVLGDSHCSSPLQGSEHAP